MVSVLVSDADGRLVRFGSGFFVRADVLATNYHVIETATEVSQITAKVAGKNEVYQVREILGADEQKDLALLRVIGIKGRPLSLGTGRKVEIGEEVYAVGSPKGLEGTFSPGIISSIRRDVNQYLIQITAPVSHGSSGGPVLSNRGEVIGIIAKGIEEGQNLNFAIPVDYLASLMTQSLVAENETLADSYVDRGDRYLDQELWPKAVEAYKNAVRLDPRSSAAYFGLGYAYRHLHRYLEAVDAYKHAIRIEPDDGFTYVHLGDALGELLKFPEAVEAYKHAIRLRPLGMFYRSLGGVLLRLDRTGEALDAYEEAVRLEPSAYSYESLGDALLSLGRDVEGIQAYKQAVRAEPTAYRYESLADAFLKLNRSAEAIYAYKDAIRIEPTAYRYQRLGNAFLKSGREPEAVAAYKEAVRLDPTAHSELGDLYRRMGRPSEAMEVYKQNNSWNELGLSYEALSRYSEAAEVYSNYATKTKDEHEARLARASLGRTYYEMGSYAKAMAVYNEIIRTKPNYAYGHHMLGKTYLKLGRVAAAKTEQRLALGILGRALVANPKNAGTHLGLYEVYLELGDKASSLNEYKALERILKDDPTVLQDQLVFRRGEFYQ